MRPLLAQTGRGQRNVCGHTKDPPARAPPFRATELVSATSEDGPKRRSNGARALTRSVLLFAGRLWAEDGALCDPSNALPAEPAPPLLPVEPALPDLVFECVGALACWRCARCCLDALDPCGQVALPGFGWTGRERRRHEREEREEGCGYVVGECAPLFLDEP